MIFLAFLNIENKKLFFFLFITVTLTVTVSLKSTRDETGEQGVLRQLKYPFLFSPQFYVRASVFLAYSVVEIK